jgi:hypothetical protein
LVGVLAGLAVGARRWRRERRDAGAADFRKERQAAYRDLWSKVEGLSVDLRTDTLSQESLRARVRDLNASILKAGLYIDEDDRPTLPWRLAISPPRHGATPFSTRGRAPIGLALRSIVGVSDIAL